MVVVATVEAGMEVAAKAVAAEAAEVTVAEATAAVAMAAAVWAAEVMVAVDSGEVVMVEEARVAAAALAAREGEPVAAVPCRSTSGWSLSAGTTTRRCSQWRWDLSPPARSHCCMASRGRRR